MIKSELKLKDNQKEIVLGAGCFWGTQAYFDKIEGVVATEVGYANGLVENPSYEQVCTGATGFAEVARIVYDPEVINLFKILEHFFRIIDPISLNKQGGDVGEQYRTGIYSNNLNDREVASQYIEIMQVNYDKKIQVEVDYLKNYYMAEDYHQDYLKKNPDGYCHIDLSLANEDKKDNKFGKVSNEEIKEKLTELQYRVTQEAATEMPFTSEYDDFYEKGLYVDIVTGQPLFVSTDKFDAGCGWPSFSKPIEKDALSYFEDDTLSRKRIEVVSKSGDSHLGHVFNDGPKEAGGLRYCINGASLRFIPYEEMDKEGYSEYKKLVE